MHLVFQQYLDRLERREAADSTLKNFNRTAVLFEESGLDPMTCQDWQIEEWLAGLRASPAPREERGADGIRKRGAKPRGYLSSRTVRLHAENLGAALGYASRRGMISVNPMEMVRLPREPDKEPRILESDDLRHILGNAMTDEQELLVLFFMYTGMRRNEVRFLQWEDITPASIRVVGKGGKLRHVPLHPALSEAVVTRTPTDAYVFPGRKGAMSESTFFYLLEKVRGRVTCTFHDFRRTVASSLYKNGVDTLIIDKILGWAPRTVGSRYYISAADDVSQRAILRLYADAPVT